MGTYFANALNLRLKKDTPVEFLDFFRKLTRQKFHPDLPFGEGPLSRADWEIPEAFSADFKQYAKDLFGTRDYGFGRWFGTTLEILPEGDYRLISLSTTKYIDHTDAYNALLWLNPYIVFEHQRVYFRSLREDFSTEIVLWYDADTLRHHNDKGYRFDHADDDPCHPAHAFCQLNKRKEELGRPLTQEEKTEFLNSIPIYTQDWYMPALIHPFIKRGVFGREFKYTPCP